MSKNIVECVHWDPEVDAAEQGSRKQNLFWIVIAASAVVIVLALSSLIFFWPGGGSSEEPSGETTLAQGDPSQPDEQVTQAPIPVEDDLNLTRGMTLYQQQSYAEAIAAFALALESNPESAAAYMYRGQCHFSLSDYNKAIVDFTQALRRAPDNAQPLIMRGGSYFFLNCYPEAISDLTAALEMKLPGDSAYSAYSYRARAYEAMGEYALAQADYTAAANLQ